MKEQKSQIPNLLFITLFFLAFLGRTIFHLGPNIEFVTTAMILSSYYLGKKSSFWLVLLIMLASDIILGNTSIFIFTWSGFLIPALLSQTTLNFLKLSNQITKTIKKRFAPTAIKLTFAGISANLFFYIWTNFGVWLLDAWGMYSKNLQGLILCYINSLPFLRNQILSSLIFIPIGFLIIEFIQRLMKNIKIKYLYRLEKT